jgi:hypothetical protein
MPVTVPTKTILRATWSEPSAKYNVLQLARSLVGVQRVVFKRYLALNVKGAFIKYTGKFEASGQKSC